MSILNKIFGRNVKSMDLNVKFHHDANLFGEHGRLNVTHRKKGLTEESIAFVFPGITTPPKLDLRLMAYLWEEAQNQGYIVHHVDQYGKANEVVDTTRELADNSGATATLRAV